MTLWRWLVLRVFFSALVASLFNAPGASAQEIIGRASVIDGDTLEIHGERIRLLGIDAPEGGQFCEDAQGDLWRCGQAAAFALDDFLQGRSVTCVERDRDQYGRMVATCDAAGDVGAYMVSIGMAVAYRKYSKAYVGQENVARGSGIGMWSGRFEMPWDWRKRN